MCELNKVRDHGVLLFLFYLIGEGPFLKYIVFIVESALAPCLPHGKPLSFLQEKWICCNLKNGSTKWKINQ